MPVLNVSPEENLIDLENFRSVHLVSNVRIKEKCR